MGILALYRRLAPLLMAGLALHAARADPSPDHAGMHEHPSSDLLLFVSGEGHHISPSPTHDLNEDAALAADIVLAVTRDKFRVFGEYLLTTEEHDLERFQLGYEFATDTVAWLGRYHQPASAWNTEHHHGRYLQTSITRPVVELWEDEGGVLPQHITGLLVETRRPLGEAPGLQASLGVGLGPLIDNEGLDPVDLLDIDRKDRKTSWTGRVAYMPEYVGASQFGLVAAHHRMPVTDAASAAALEANEVGQSVFGPFADWHADPWRIVAAIYAARLTYYGATAASHDSFVAGYVQFERQLPDAVTAYMRLENSSHADQSRYILAVNPDFVLRRTTAGLRWDFRSHQALTAEFASGSTLTAQPTAIRVQWSAVFP